VSDGFPIPGSEKAHSFGCGKWQWQRQRNGVVGQRAVPVFSDDTRRLFQVPFTPLRHSFIVSTFLDETLQAQLATLWFMFLSICSCPCCYYVYHCFRNMPM